MIWRKLCRSNGFDDVRSVIYVGNIPNRNIKSKNFYSCVKENCTNIFEKSLYLSLNNPINYPTQKFIDSIRHLPDCKIYWDAIIFWTQNTGVIKFAENIKQIVTSVNGTTNLLN